MVYKFKIGQRVYVRHSAFTTSRWDRIAGFHVSHSGLPMYFLQGGGLLAESELELAQQ